MTDSSEIGRYGTLRLLKRHEPETTLAYFPVDDETVTFGRSKQCSIRLYYDCVSELHCTLQISEERKAFLLVQGTNGLLVDGCQVNPSRSSASGPTTVPLTNGSEIEIYKKRFKFEYPPKEIRIALLATPRNVKARSSLRMSMIRSAQVFTPRGNSDAMPQTPRRDIGLAMDWEALKSPIKVPSQDGSPEQEMTLLEGEGEDAIVVEEEKDIIVLEKVDNTHKAEVVSSSRPKSNRGRSVAFSIHAVTPPPKPIPIPQSARISQHKPQAVPVNRRRSAPSLHRAVVLRSAQRALQREQERVEEEQEEDEVEAEVSPERELGPFEANGNEDNDIFCEDVYDEIPEPYPAILPSNAPPARPARRMSAFRASLDAMRKVIPLPFNWKSPEEVPLPDEDDDYYDKDHEKDDDHDRDDNRDELEDKQEPIVQTPVRHNLGPFMTPQVKLNRSAQRIQIGQKARASVGGNSIEEGATQKIFGGAQRVRVVPAWKITDIILQEPETSLFAEGRQEVKKERISEEERQAIMARRKSALNTPSGLPMPGPRTSPFPPPAESDAYTPGEHSDEDADTMIEKMKQKMASVRRKSEVRKIRLGRRQGEEFSLLASSVGPKKGGFSNTGIPNETSSSMKRPEHSDQDIAELLQEDTGSSSHMQDHDDLDLLEASNDEVEAPATAVTPGAPSLTPRFDGVREMFRQPRAEPRTPSFTGFATMFKEPSERVTQTPSFRGIREMFNRTTGLATPFLNLQDIFDEDDGPAIVTEPVDKRHTAKGGLATAQPDCPLTSPERTTHVVKSEDESAALTSVSKMSTRSRKTAVSTSNRPSRRRDVSPADVPSTVLEEPSDNQEEKNDIEEVEPTPAPNIRRVTNRSSKRTTTPTNDNIPLPGESSVHRASRTKRKATAPASEDTTKGIVVHKTTKSRMAAENDSEEEPTKSSGKTRFTGTRGKRKTPQASETEIESDHHESEVPVKPKVSSRRGKETQTSDSDGVAPPKPHRGRAAKTTDCVEPVEITSAPTISKATRRTKTEESPDVGYPATVSKAPRSKQGARTKGSKPVNRLPAQIDHSSEAEAEDIPPPPTKGRASKKGWIKKKTVTVDIISDDDKENSEQQQLKSSDKTPAIRTRRTVVTPVEALDAPAKRTRSKK